eukprot:scaffold41217_cov51-Phaeocystis_antarctica.AAC.3
MQEMPVQSVIVSPVAHAALEPGEDTTLQGFAWSGGGRGITRVECSADDGRSWHTARPIVSRAIVSRAIVSRPIVSRCMTQLALLWKAAGPHPGCSPTHSGDADGGYLTRSRTPTRTLTRRR